LDFLRFRTIHAGSTSKHDKFVEFNPKKGINNNIYIPERDIFRSLFHCSCRCRPE
jgi:hypothetical protein